MLERISSTNVSYNVLAGCVWFTVISDRKRRRPSIGFSLLLVLIRILCRRWVRGSMTKFPLHHYSNCYQVISSHIHLHCLVWNFLYLYLAVHAVILFNQNVNNLFSEFSLLFFVVMFSHYSHFTAMYIGKSWHFVAGSCVAITHLYNWQEKTGRRSCHSATNPTPTDLDANPGLRVEKPETNCLSGLNGS